MSDDWYFNVGAETAGPISYDALVAKIREAPDQIQLVWTNGMADWANARTVQTFATFFASGPPPLPASVGEAVSPYSVQAHTAPPHTMLLQTGSPQDVAGQSRDAESVTVQLHPWRRYFARMIDIWIFSWVAGIVILLAMNVLVSSQAANYINDQMLGWVMVALYIPFEALLLQLFGTTFGKYLYGIVLRQNGSSFSYAQALRRSTMVWWRGLGTGFPLASLLTLTTAYSNLKKNKVTSWDRDCDCTVSHAQMSSARLIAILLVWALLLVIISAIIVAPTPARAFD
ncbi:hypothetical protein ACVIJ6_001144 [Bradyrhizobium sp. USDA 4369]